MRHPPFHTLDDYAPHPALPSAPPSAFPSALPTSRLLVSLRLSEGFLPLVAAVTAAVRAHLPAFDSLQRLAEKMSADDVLSLVNSVRATLETDLQETYKGGNGNGNGGSGESRLNGHAVAGSNEDGGDAAGGDFKQRDDVLSLYLLREMSDEHGAIPEGDQLHVLLDEVIATLKSSAYRLTLADLIHIAFETLDTETHVVIARQSDAVKDGEAGAVGTAGEAGAAGAAAAASLTLAKLLAQIHNLALGALAAPAPFVEALLATEALDEFCWMTYLGD